MFKEMERQDKEGIEFNPIYIMADSGARGIEAADPPARRHARPHGQALGRDHREPDHLELPRRPHRAAVLHLDPRRPQGPGRHRAQDRRLRLPDPAPGGRQPGRDHLRARLRHRGRHRDPAHHRVGRGHRAPARPHHRPRQPRAASRTRSTASVIVEVQRGDQRGDGQRDPGRRHREGPHPLGAHLRVACAACAPCATAATSPPASSSRWAWRSASSPRSRSASRAPSSPCGRSTSAAPRSHTSQQTTLEAKNAGLVKFHNVTTVKDKKGDLVVMNRSGALDHPRPEGPRDASATRSSTAPGSRSRTARTVKQGQLLVEWDPYSFTILTEDEGQVDVQGRPRRPDRARAGGREHRHVARSSSSSRRTRRSSPASRSRDEKGKIVRKYLLPSGRPPHGRGRRRRSSPGDVLAKIPRETAKTKDITGGLPARGRAVRGAAAEGARGHHRDRRDRQVRRRAEAVPQDLRDRRRRRDPRVPAAPRRRTSTSRRASG